MDWLRGDILAALPDDVKALVVGPCMDMMTSTQAAGASQHLLICMRGLIRRMVRGLYDVEVRRGAARGCDFDVTTGYGSD